MVDEVTEKAPPGGIGEKSTPISEAVPAAELAVENASLKRELAEERRRKAGVEKARQELVRKLQEKQAGENELSPAMLKALEDLQDSLREEIAALYDAVAPEQEETPPQRPSRVEALRQERANRQKEQKEQPKTPSWDDAVLAAQNTISQILEAYGVPRTELLAHKQFLEIWSSGNLKGAIAEASRFAQVWAQPAPSTEETETPVEKAKRLSATRAQEELQRSGALKNEGGASRGAPRNLSDAAEAFLTGRLTSVEYNEAKRRFQG